MEDGGVHVDRVGQGGWWLHFEEGEPGDDGHEATQLVLGVEFCVHGEHAPCEAPDNTMFSLGIPSSTNSSITPSMVAKASSRSSLLSPATGESTDAPGISQKLNQDVTKGPAPGIIVGGKIAVLFVGHEGHLTSFMFGESQRPGTQEPLTSRGGAHCQAVEEDDHCLLSFFPSFLPVSN